MIAPASALCRRKTFVPSRECMSSRSAWYACNVGRGHEDTELSGSKSRYQTRLRRATQVVRTRIPAECVQRIRTVSFLGRAGRRYVSTAGEALTATPTAGGVGARHAENEPPGPKAGRQDWPTTGTGVRAPWRGRSPSGVASRGCPGSRVRRRSRPSRRRPRAPRRTGSPGHPSGRPERSRWQAPG